MNMLRPEAEKLREQGYSYKFIEEKLGVSRGTLSYWFKDKPFQPNDEVLERTKKAWQAAGERKHNQRISETQAQMALGISEIGRLNKRDLWLLGIGIYIGEGAKSIEAIRISNADPRVIKLSIAWLLSACSLTKENLRIRLHIYPDNDEKECIKYWMKVTGLGPENFSKTIIDTRINKQKLKQGRLSYGTAHISVRSNKDPEKGKKLYRRLNGWMTGVFNQL